MSDRKEFLFKDDTWHEGMKALCLARSGTTRVVEDRWSSDLREREAFYLHSDYLNSTNSESDNYAMSVPGVGPRFEMAIPRAFVINVAV